MTYAQGRLQRSSSWPSGTTFSLRLLFNTLEAAMNLIPNGDKRSLATISRIDPMEGRSLQLSIYHIGLWLGTTER